jgi:hypothetical protein
MLRNRLPVRALHKVHLITSLIAAVEQGLGRSLRVLKSGRRARQHRGAAQSEAALHQSQVAAMMEGARAG